MSLQPSIVDFLSDLRTRHIKLWVEDHQLRYSAPKQALTPDLRAELLRRKAEIIAFFETAQTTTVTTPRLQPVAHGALVPLSFAQQRLWLLDQLTPGSTAYIMPGLVRLRGTLNIPVFERSLNAIIERHEVLRTTFGIVEGEPHQQIGTHRPLVVPVIDLQPLSEAERAPAVERQAIMESTQPFDLQQGPLIRARLLRIAADEHLLLLTLHHIISDGWSLGVLLRELAALYPAGGDATALPPLPVQYADYTLWQRAWLQGEIRERQLAFWREQLAGAPETLALPTDFPRPPVQSFRGAAYRFRLSPGLTAALHALSQRADATLFMTLLTAWSTLLARATGQWDLTVGTPIANRTQAALEGLIGFFVNTLVLRTNLAGNPTFLDALARVRAVTLAAYAQQDLPFEHVVEALQPQRSLSSSPLFQVLFALQNAPLPDLRLGAVTLHVEDTRQTTAKFDLSLVLTETDDGLDATLEYATDLFAAATIERLAQHWQTLLSAIVAQPEQPIATLPLLTAAERDQLLSTWNATQRPYPHGGTVHALVAAQAQRRPEAVALVYGAEQLTYAALEARANRLAHQLRALGVGPEVLVGLCLERSITLVVAMLAVLKAGGAYVPLDPSYPAERLAFMLADAEIPVVLTDTRLREQVPVVESARSVTVLCVDTALDHSAPEWSSAPLSETTAADVAYVMYTSGSTGQPKGTAITHRAIVRLICNTDYVQLTPDDRVAQASNTAFDAATFEIWGALISGARVVGVDRETALSPERFAAWLRDQAITTMFMTTAWFNQVAANVPSAFASVRQLMFGGEEGDPQSVRNVLKHGKPERLINVYGPTESTTFASWFEIETLPDEATSVPIGQPIANTTLYILDAQLQPVPIGVPGELYIGGDGLARGYFRRPALTAEKFIPHPFSGGASSGPGTDPGARLYRTGDLVRALPDGTIVFLGRIDQQIKLRGFRVEIGEIEAVLSQHPAVSQALVLLREDQPGDRRLVAYLVAQPNQPITVSEIRAFLLRQLPEYLVPAAFVVLDRLPLTPNGKVDRRALPAPEYGQSDTPVVAPRTPLETLIAGIWADVLGRQQVSIHDNFFALGGHSLLATQVITRIRDACQIELPLRALFETPTIASIAEQVANSQPERALLPALAPRPAAHDEPLPLSFAQQRLWFLHQLDPQSTVYHTPILVRLTGALDVEALRRGLQMIVQRHESLRTAFVLRNAQPVQAIVPEVALPLPLNDLSALTPTDRTRAIAQLTESDIRQPFDLAEPPLLRARVLRVAADEHLLLLTLHHIITDGWSLGVLLRELAALYVDPTVVLEPLPVQYADYALWQRQWLHGAIRERQLAFWREQLAGAPETLALPTDFPRPPVQSFRGAAYRFRLSPGLTAALHALSQRADATLFMTLLTAWSTLLARATGQWDLTVGTPIANRTQAALEGLIGFFVNTLVLRTDLAGNPSFLEALARVRAVTLAAYAQQDLPFEHLVEALQPHRSLSSSPLFQVLFALQNAPLPDLRLGAVTLHVEDTPQTTAKFDLSLVLTETDDGLDALLEYATDLFAAATIERLAAHLVTLLDAVCANPQLPLAAIPLLTAAEREQLLTTWNQSARPYPHDGTVHALVAAQAQRQPNAVALVYGAEQLTYAELNARANQLAHQLRALGVGPEVLVGLCLERSITLVVAMLAVLKAGGAYVPLDPSYPTERLAFMLQDTQTPVILTEERFLALLPEHSAHTVCLDTAWDRIAHQPATAPAVPVTADGLAYVMYTSGSTGQPKGTAITHRAIVRLICNTDYVQLTPDDRVAQASNTAFDAATFEVWGALISGAQLIGIPKEIALSPVPFAALLREQAVTTIFMTTAWFNQVSSLAPDALHTLRNVLFGGEASDPQRVRTVLSQQPPLRLLHVYGPTESTTFTSWYEVRDVPEDATSVPIGQPIANTTLYVLDAQRQPVPIGVPGELYIGGDGLARGYLNRPELTAEKFVPNPFGAPGSRLYRTGDLARYRADGAIDFVGRIDHQVKLRGFRIELGEIEAVLSQHPAVQETIVVVREDQAGDPRLVAYVVENKEQTNKEQEDQDNGTDPCSLFSVLCSPDDLREFLVQRLPAYMLPAAIVVLERLPLTPNGKVDRRALPAPDYTQAAETFIAPRTPLEAQIAGIWAEVLGVERVGVTDNFFALGGHSLLATQVITRIRDACQIELPLRALFETPTIAGIAEQVARSQPERALLPALAPRPAAHDEPLPLSFAQQRLWFLQQLDPQSTVYHTPILVRLTGALDVDALQRSLQTIVQRHESLRTTFPLHAEQPVQTIEPQVALPLPLDDLSPLAPTRRAQAIERLIQEDTQRPFDLTVAPLLRAHVLRVAADEHLLLLTLHHIITDGWSLGVLLRELAALYVDPTVVLKPLAVQYADYALWQRQWLHGAIRERQLAFWREQLAGAPETLALPTDFPRPPVQSFRGAAYRFRLSPGLTAALHALSRRADATLFMTLLTAWSTLLARYAGQWDLTVGTPIANRTQAALEPLIGFFVNTLVLRTDLAGNPSFLDALARVRAVTLAAYAQQDLPFEHLVEALHPNRSLSSSPLFQVMLALQNAPLPDLRLGEVTLHVEELPQSTAKFDLSLALTETDQGIDATLEYATDLFAAPTIERLATHLVTLLDAVCANPQLPLAAIPLLTAAEREQLLSTWNQNALPYPTTDCIHDLVAAQAARTPDGTALVAGSQSLSYAALNARANQLAHELQAHGVGPEVRVGVFLDRTSDLVVALLAVLKAGGCYVPLDPAYPAERIQVMLEDSQAAVILTDQPHRALLPAHTAHTICLDAEWPRIAERPSTDPVTAIQPANLAYLIYTSGSTGRPKGVAIPHASAVALLHWAWNTFEAADLARVAAGTSICFDLSIFELFVPLSGGGTVQLLSNALEIPALADAPVTLLNTVPSVMAEVLRSGALPPSVRVINLAGEPLTRALADALYAAAPSARVYNLYGPSEDTTYSTYTLVAPDDTQAPTIGRPIANTQAYILDAEMQPVPIGVVGELYLGGAGLARGYLHRPELTAERFVPDPFGDPGARLYRTGDLARYLPDGQIVFLGRSDHQVKVRGFRIELGEIEAALRQHEAVREAVVTVLHESSDARLVAYVVEENQEPRTKNQGDDSDGSRFLVAQRAPGSTLREFLRDRLPAYMIPSLFVPLETLPLTPSGKIDRKALPRPDGERPDLESTFVAPRTPTEERIAQIWQDVLGLEQVGIYDNFFDIGGHSLLATQIMTRIRTTFQVNPALRTLFEQPTIAYLAQIIEQETKQPTPPPRSKIQALPRRGGSRQLANKLDQLSEQEIQRLLEERKTAQTGESSHD